MKRSTIDRLWVIVPVTALVAILVLVGALIWQADYAVTTIEHGCTVITHRDWLGQTTSVQRACP